MSTTTAVNLIRVDANRDEIIAHLDASPDWERVDLSALAGDRLDWKARHDIVADVYGPSARDVYVQVPLWDVYDLPALRNHLSRVLGETVNAINALALRLPAETHFEVIDRIADAYKQLPPNSTAALILSGQVEAE